jgi:hypothetical protein
VSSGVDPVAGTEPSTATANRVGLYSAILIALVTALTFGLAIIAIPNSGAGCQVDCVEYPYLDTLSEFPRDYLWMPPAMVLVVLYVVLVSSIHAQATPHKKVYAQIGLSFALLAAGVLLRKHRHPEASSSGVFSTSSKTTTATRKGTTHNHSLARGWPVAGSRGVLSLSLRLMVAQCRSPSS